MRQNVLEEMHSIVDKYFLEADLNHILKQFIAEKAELAAYRINAHAKPNISKISQMLASSIMGQQKDLNHSVLTEADYIAMVQLKSGSLIQFAYYMGYSFIPDLTEETITLMDDLAKYLSVALQIENDLNDVLKYEVKNDLLQKKRTLPILFLLKDSPEEFPPLIEFYEGKTSEQEFLLRKQDYIQYIQDSGCMEYCRIIQSLFVEKAEEIYESISAISPWKEKFKEITFATR